MSKLIHSEAGVRVFRMADGHTEFHIMADKIPNRHNSGHTLENGNTTRSFARLIARKVLDDNNPQVSPAVDAYHVGSDLWRVYALTTA